MVQRLLSSARNKRGEMKNTELKYSLENHSSKNPLSHKHNILQKMSKLSSGGYAFHFLYEWKTTSMKTTWQDLLSPHQCCTVMASHLLTEECGGERRRSKLQSNHILHLIQLFQESEVRFAKINEQIWPNTYNKLTIMCFWISGGTQ